MESNSTCSRSTVRENTSLSRGRSYETSFIDSLKLFDDHEYKFTLEEAKGKYDKHLIYGSVYIKCAVNGYSYECTAIGNDYFYLSEDRARENAFKVAYHMLRRRFSQQMREYELASVSASRNAPRKYDTHRRML